MPHPFIQFCTNMSLSVFLLHSVNLKLIDKVAIAAARLRNDHFAPQGGDIVQVNNQLRADRTLKLTFTNVKPFLKLIVMVLERCIMKIKALTPKLSMIVCDIME